MKATTGSPTQLGSLGSLALGAAIVASQAFFAFTGRWFLFATSAVLGVGMPLLAIVGPTEWGRVMRGITGRDIDAASVDRRKALTAALALGFAALVILVAALMR